MTRLLLTASALGALALCPPALAQEAFELDEIVISGAFSALVPQPLSRTGAAVEVLGPETLQDSPGRTLPETLGRLPGVSATSSGGRGAQTNLRIRGLDSRYVGVRVDGIDITDPSSTQVALDFGGLPTSAFGQVEVIKGSQGALFGSEAIAGVVDITTAQGEALGFSGFVSAEAGSFETYSGATALTQRTERGQLSFSLSRLTTDGISALAADDETDAFSQTFATLSGDYAVSDAVTLGFSALYREADLERDLSAADNGGESATEQAGARVFARLDAGGILHEVSYSAFSSDRRDKGGFTPEFLGDRKQLAYLGTTEVGTTTLTFGADWTEETIRTGTTNAEDETVSVLGEALFRPTSDLDIAVSLRRDESDDFGGETTGRVALAWQAGPETTLRAVAGTGFRAPSLFERFSSFGDPDLEAEESRSLELGVERRFGAESFVKATAFYTEIDNLIDFDGFATACGSGFGCYAQVEGTTRTRGLELSGRYAFAGGQAALFGNYTYTEAETEAGRLPLVPRHDLLLGIEGRLADGLRGQVDMRHVADVEASPFAPADNEVGDYTLANLSLTYDLGRGTEAQLRVENVLDEDYETVGGFNQPGRAVYLALRRAF